MTKNTKQPSLRFFRNCPALIYFTIGMFLSGCVAKFPVSTIYANDSQTHSLVQWPETIEESDTQLVKIRPLENIDEMLLFELEVTNKSQEPIPITPQNWQLGYFSNYTKSESTSADSLSYPLSGSEVNKGYQKVAQDIKAAKDGTTALIVVGIVLIVAIFIIIAANSDNNSSDNTSYYSYDNYMMDVGLNMSFAFFNQSYEPPITEEWSEKDKIAFFRERGEELKKVDNGPHMIPPGETYFYGLFFPRKKEARHLSLKGVIGNESYAWNFQHDGLNLPKAGI